MDVTKLVDYEHGLVSRRIFAERPIYEQEMEQIFARCWLMLGHESQITRPGDFFTTYMGEDGVIVCRDTRGQIQALLNSCRHRGNRICRLDQGRAASFMCTYHGWTYDLQGKLVGVPGYEEVYYGELDRKKWGLVPVAQVDTYRGLIFGTFDPEAPPLGEYLGDIRWGMDILLDQRAGGTELAGGVFKWTMNCNWKFGCDNFIGDVIHGNTTHKSASMVGHRTDHRLPAGRSSDLGVLNRPGFTISTECGHGFNASLRTPGADGRGPAGDLLAGYYRSVAAETEERLGSLRAKEVTRINCGIFPNLSLSSSSRMLHVWHPRGPTRTEVWLYALVDREAPPEIKEAMRLASQRHFSPSGMFEQDDGENWEQSTLPALGAVARRYPLNYQMGTGHERSIDDGLSPKRLDSLTNEHNQRVFYRRWAEMIAADGWDQLRPLLDEPTAHLDPHHQHAAMAVAQTLATEGAAVLAVLHDLNLAAAYADRIGLLAGGRLLALGAPCEVLTAERLAGVFSQPFLVTPHPAIDRPLVLPLPVSNGRPAVTPPIPSDSLFAGQL